LRSDRLENRDGISQQVTTVASQTDVFDNESATK
jgi:hypothetical protein